MESITVKGRILSKDLSETVWEDITIKCNGLDKNQNMVYSYALPKHIYDNLVDTSQEFQSFQKYNEKKKEQGANFSMSEKYLKKNIEEILISSVIETIERYSDIILNERNKDNLKKTKKIFINFSWSNTDERCNWTGGYKGKRISSSYQFFMGYEVEEPAPLSAGNWLNREERATVINYYTLIKYASGSMEKWSTNGQEGNHLEPLYFQGKKEEFLRTYNVIDWTQEREDYLTDLQKKFIMLNTHLNDYLSDLSNEKLDLLIEAKDDMKLLK